jgi:hypothetical protein
MDSQAPLESATLESLPEDVQQRIIELAGPASWPSLLATCRWMQQLVHTTGARQAGNEPGAEPTALWIFSCNMLQ